LFSGQGRGKTALHGGLQPDRAVCKFGGRERPRISVTGNGRGIEPSRLGRIFRWFDQADLTCHDDLRSGLRSMKRWPALKRRG
jgi:hypothetical protein